jgi:tetratricopeptide (TPR) repeat protein
LTQKKLEDCRLELNGLRTRIFRSRLQRHPDQLELLVPLAESLQQLDRMEEAVEALRRAAAEPSLRAGASFQLGKLLEKLGKVPAALSAYRRAALFRLPPPKQELKIKALTAAVELSERHQLHHSAVRYLKLLRDLQPEDESCQERLKNLESKV